MAPEGSETEARLPGSKQRSCLSLAKYPLNWEHYCTECAKKKPVESLPFVVKRLHRSFLLISNIAFLSCWMVSCGFLTSRYSNNWMVGLWFLHCSSFLITSLSTCSSHAKCFQFLINLVFLSKHNANSSKKSGWHFRTSNSLES